MHTSSILMNNKINVRLRYYMIFPAVKYWPPPVFTQKRRLQCDISWILHIKSFTSSFQMKSTFHSCMHLLRNNYSGAIHWGDSFIPSLSSSTSRLFHPPLLSCLHSHLDIFDTSVIDHMCMYVYYNLLFWVTSLIFVRESQFCCYGALFFRKHL